MKERPLSPSGYRPVRRRGLSRTEAAIYVGVSTTKFDQMIVDGRMPKPRRIDARRVWDIRALDQAFDSLPGGEDYVERNPWDEVYLTVGGSPDARNERNTSIEVKTYTPEEWKQIVCVSPLGKREHAGLGAYYYARNEKLSYVKGAGINTTERLEARGFISVTERRGDRVPYYRITPEGQAAWLRLQKS
jgi:predicted DNA-binding transcriptional regulator AlpA